MNRKNRLLITAIAVMLMGCVVISGWILRRDGQRRAEAAAETGRSMTAEIAENIIDYTYASAEFVGGRALDHLAAMHVVSHRGSAGDDEHSFDAYDRAIEAGSEYIEQDLVISADGTLYVSHDLGPRSMTGESGAYSEMTDEKIDSLRTFKGNNILRLSDVFERYGRDIGYVIELKSADSASVDAFVSLLKEYGVQDRVTVQCFEAEALEALEPVFPEMPKLYLCRDAAGFEKGLETDCADIIAVRSDIMSAARCREAHDRGKLFGAWTIDTESGIRQAIEADVDLYFTNDTALAISLEKSIRCEDLRKKLNAYLKKIAKLRPGDTDDEPLGTVFFASDYQQEPGWDEPREVLKDILEQAAADGKTPDKFVYCGDYTNDSKLFDYQLSPDDAIDEIKNTIRETVSGSGAGPQDADASDAPDDDDFVFVQGNHDAMTSRISDSGLHDLGECLVYVLNTENDFPWKQGRVSGSHDKVAAAAVRLRETLDRLIADGEMRPVFIAGHVPLHYSARTSSLHTTGDNLYSSLIFDVVNEAAESLDIVYLFGHNHSKGWDCYLGGSCVYRSKGDTLLIPVDNGGSTTDSFDAEELRFTYLNAGYTGYYMNCSLDEWNAGSADKYRAADETLTGTVCEIYKDRIVLIRYSRYGVHDLGSAGAANPYRNDGSLIGAEHYGIRTAAPQQIERK